MSLYLINKEDFINLYKKCTAKPCSLVIDANFVSDNPLRFRNNLVERISKIIVINGDKISNKNISIIIWKN